MENPEKITIEVPDEVRREMIESGATTAEEIEEFIAAIARLIMSHREDAEVVETIITDDGEEINLRVLHVSGDELNSAKRPS